MRIKSDFVTNSSSTSYIIEGKFSCRIKKKRITKEKHMYDATTLDMIKLIEGILQYDPDFKEISNKEIIINYQQNVWEIFGDGWDGGDYNFSGYGYRFFGRTKILKDVMTKNKILKFKNGKLNFPKEWINDCDPDIIKEKYNIVDEKS
jgi:hypothetical protein